MNEKWTEIVVQTDISMSDRAEAALHMAAPLGLYIEDYSDMEDTVKRISGIDLIDDTLLSKDRRAVLLHAYFPPGSSPGECEAAVRARLDYAGAVYSVESSVEIAEEDWANNWKQYFKPLRVGKSILIRPEWIILDEQADAQLLAGVKAVVGIDPGMAFGTGGHASTRMCLELAERYFETLGAVALSQADVLDVGCGSGILSVASVLLGARSAYGVDTDEYAVKNARENAVNNKIARRAEFAKGDLLSGVKGRFRVIFANIVADAVIRLLPEARARLLLGGAIIASGIIDDREADVIGAISDNGYQIAGELRSEGWTAFLLKTAD